MENMIDVITESADTRQAIVDILNYFSNMDLSDIENEYVNASEYELDYVLDDLICRVNDLLDKRFFVSYHDDYPCCLCLYVYREEE